MKRPTEKLSSFASLIVYSMSQDSPASRSTPTGTNTPLDPNSKKQTYLAGSKALDSLAKLIQATESFFHPSNYGAWAPHLGRFLQTLTWEFHRRVKVSLHISDPRIRADSKFAAGGGTRRLQDATGVEDHSRHSTSLRSHNEDGRLTFDVLSRSSHYRQLSVSAEDDGDPRTGSRLPRCSRTSLPGTRNSPRSMSFFSMNHFFG